MTTDLRIPASAAETHTRSRALAVRFRFFVRKFVFAKQSHFTPAASRIAWQRPTRQQYATGTLARVRGSGLGRPKTLPANRAGDPPLPSKWQNEAIRVDEPDHGDPALVPHRPPRRERSVRFQLPTLRSAADAASAMAALTAGVAAGEITPGEAAEFSKLVEAYIKALEAGEFDQRLRAVEARNDATRP